jgi:hypothetical protein
VTWARWWADVQGRHYDDLVANARADLIAQGARPDVVAWAVESLRAQLDAALTREVDFVRRVGPDPAQPDDVMH